MRSRELPRGGLDHGHGHGKADPAILRSRESVRALAVSLAILAVTAVVQAVVFALTNSVALLADTIHNAGDALTALPLAAAFLLRSRRVERFAGFAVVAAIFISAVVAAVEAVDRLLSPHHLDHLIPLAIAGAVGVIGNELAARVRLHAGTRLHSHTLLADGAHARTDGYVSLGVIISAVAVGAGWPAGDPIVSLVITVVILRATWQAWQTVGQPEHNHGH